MARRCRLCRKPATEGSIFCEDHRNQAQLFSATFGPHPQEGVAPLAAPLPTPGTQPAPSGSSPLGTGLPSRPARPETGKPPVEDLGAGTLQSRVGEALRAIQAWAHEQPERAARRWPLISIYCLHDRLLSRSFYSIVPAARLTESAPGAFEVASTEVAEALGPGGDVFAELRRLYLERRERLRTRELQTLDVHLLAYAGVIAINERLPNQRETNVATFARNGNGFASVEADSVRERLGHERW